MYMYMYIYWICIQSTPGWHTFFGKKRTAYACVVWIFPQRESHTVKYSRMAHFC